MRIVMYQTYSGIYDDREIVQTYYPSKSDMWKALAEKYPQHEIVFVTRSSGYMLLEKDKDGTVIEPSGIRCVLIDEALVPADFAQVIVDLAPAVAVAVSSPEMPLDWNSLEDAIIAEILQEHGIKTIAQKIFTAIATFDKWRTHLVLRELGFGVAKAVYIHNDLFWAESKIAGIESNVYKHYIQYRVENLSYPVIVKDTVGVASIGIQIVDTPEEAWKILTSGNKGTDVLVEELIRGEQFGTEIHGVKGSYHVLPPFRLGLNDEGIVDPVTGMKFGPVLSEQYNVRQLQESLRRLAETLEFGGSAEIDLAFRDGKWYVIEINPRMSGLTSTAAAAEERTPLDIYMESALGSAVDYSDPENLRYTLTFRVPTPSDDALRELNGLDHVIEISNVKSTVANIVFENSGFVLGGFASVAELFEELTALRERYPEIFTEKIVHDARFLAEG
ncbi:ATP-grasp domain-containing protein [Bifidobacterium sp.]|uniref:ATP-grasp domain-containing protein n=1 Tax=Bifidobacterium sp. TaxID=41200 RepID=UPI0039E82DBF